MRLEVSLRKRMRAFSLDVTLDATGEVLTLFGPSGAGKSLTLQVLAGLIRPDDGRVAIDGEVLLDTSLGKDAPPQERRMGYVPQSYALFPHMTVEENLGFGLRRRPASETRAAVAAMLERMRLTEVARHHPFQLSGGQKQRVALARALIVKPRLLLLDEPFAALDAPLRAGVRADLLSARRDLSVAIVLVTHDVADVHVLADTVAVMAGGHVLQVGSRDAVFRQPASADVARMTGAGNLLAGEVVERQGERGRIRMGTVSIEAALPPGCNAHVTVVIRPELVRLLADGEAAAPGESLLEAMLLTATPRGLHTAVELSLPAVGAAPLEVVVPVWWWNRHGKSEGLRFRIALPRDSIHILPAAAATDRGDVA